MMWYLHGQVSMLSHDVKPAKDSFYLLFCTVRLAVSYRHNLCLIVVS